MWALLPLKEFANAKQRLSGVLDGAQRIRLQEAMVSDVLHALDGHPDLDGIVVVSSDPAARRLAQACAADFIDENEFGVHGLNPAVQAAVMRQARDGEDEVLVIHGDVPLVTPAEIGLLVWRHRLAPAPALTLATDRRGDGSNVLLCSASAAIAFAYGKGSCARHKEEARRRGMSCEVLTLPGASCDIDEPEDLLALLEHPNLAVARHTRDYLCSSGIAETLPARENA